MTESESVRRAREVLAGRIQAYGRELDAELLRSLEEFISAGRPPRFAAALEAFATACRLAAFDRTVRVEDRAPADALPPDPGLQPLLETLARLEKRLLEEAEGQEWSDANLNAAQFRLAADQVARARALLG